MKIDSPSGKFEIKSTFVTAVSGFPFGGDKHPHYKFHVSIKGHYGTTSFNYYGSYNDYEKGKDVMDEQDLLNAFENILGDAIAGSSSFEDFISEMGYLGDKNSKRIYKECQNTLSKIMTKLKLSLDEIIELANWLREKYDI